MPNEYLHPSDQHLLSYADNELSSREAKHIRAHLETCPECSARMTKMEVAISDFLQIHHRNQQSESDISGPRALLRAHLADRKQNSGNQGWRHLSFALDARGLICVCVLGILAILGTRFVYRRTAAHAYPANAFSGLLPDPNLTPGSTRQVTMTHLCLSDHDEVVRAVPNPVERKVFKEYGMQGVPEKNYEVDYLITPGLGGSGDIRNLWPEPHYNTVWNSYVKDQLENHLHQMVCGGKLSLSQAQKDIADNWIAAYKKYFHTNRPLPLSPSSIASNDPAMIPDREPHFL